MVVILGILAGMLVPRLAGRSEQARRARAEADVKGTLPLALDVYEVDNGVYPSSEQGLQALIVKPNTEPTPRNWNGPYLKSQPIDPWGHPYFYRYPAQRAANDYDIASWGPNGVEGGGDDVANW